MANGLVIPKEVSLESILLELKDINKEQAELSKKYERYLDLQKSGKELNTAQLRRKVELEEKIRRNEQAKTQALQDDPVYAYLKKIFPEKYEAKLNRYYEKYLIKNKYFQLSMKAFIGIQEAIENQGSWFSNLLKFLGLLAIFDPKGTFLSSVLDTLITGFIMVLNFLIPWIPKIIKTIFNLIPIIVDKLASLIPTLLKSIANILFTTGKEAGGVIGQILKLLSYIVGSDTLIWFLQSLVKSLKIIIPFMLVFVGSLKLLSAIFTVISKSIAFVTTAIEILTTAATTLGIGLGALIGWIALAIVAVVAIGYGIYMLYKNWDKVKSFFKQINESLNNFFSNTLPTFISNGFSKIGEWLGNFFMATLPKFFIKWAGVILASLFGILFGPIGAIVAYLAVKIFQNWDKIKEGWKLFLDTVEYYWVKFTNIFNWKALVKKAKKGWNKFIGFFNFDNLINYVKKGWNKVTSFFTFADLTGQIKAGWTDFKNYMKDLWKVIRGPFDKLQNYMSSLFLWVQDMIKNPFSSISMVQAQGITEIAQKTGFSKERVTELVKAKGKKDLTKAEQSALTYRGIKPGDLSKELAGLGDENTDRQVKALDSIKKAVENLNNSDDSGNPNLKGSFEGRR